ncbi:hypothetical protein G7054_g5215 [Neopestalotiopsis clavispora]|nr:hypothetical protein G7054_g5215 [Neopestalotiopsis clavispora]
MGKSKSAKPSKSIVQKGAESTNKQVSLPNWPAFKPPLPVAHLTLEPPVPAFEDKILVTRNFFPKSLCRDFVAFLHTLPLTTTPGRPKRGEAVRVNDRFQIEDFNFAQRLWTETGLKDLVQDETLNHLCVRPNLSCPTFATFVQPLLVYYHEPMDPAPRNQTPQCGFVSRRNGCEFTKRALLTYFDFLDRYSKGQFFDAHYDDFNDVTLPATADRPESLSTRTTWTLLLYLTSAAEGCLGGQTVFYPHDRKVGKEEIVVELETGMMLLHKHGDDCLLLT